MDDDRIDFSALDPKREPMRFERMVQLTLAGLRLSGAGSAGLVRQVAIWGRAAMADAALVAVVAWLPALFAADQRVASNAVRATDPVDVVSQWANAGKVPAEVDPVDALGDLDGR